MYVLFCAVTTHGVVDTHQIWDESQNRERERTMSFVKNPFMKKGVAALGAAVVIMSIAGCGNKTEGSAGSSDGTLSGEITFQTWNLKNDKYTQYFEDLIAAYEKENPNTKINWIDQPSDNYEQKLSADAAAGNLPDIVDAGPSLMYGLVKAGVLMNVSEEDPTAQQLYTEGAWSGVTFKGNGIEEGSYGYPWYVNDGPMYYNTKLMEECGLDPNTLPVTWDDYFTQADTMVASGCGAYMSTMFGGSLDDYASAGIKIINDDHTEYVFNSDEAVAHLQRFVDLYQKGGIPAEALNAQWSQQGEYFQRGSLISMGGSAYSAMDFEKNSPDLYANLAVGTKITDEGRSSTVSYEMLGVNAQTQNKPLAIDFARYVTNAENMLAFAKKSNTFPSSAEGLNDDYYKSIDTSTVLGEALSVALKAVTNGYACRPSEFTDATGGTYLQQQTALAVQGEISAKEALDKVVEYANSKLNS